MDQDATNDEDVQEDEKPQAQTQSDDSDENVQKNKLFVGNLSYTATDEDMAEAFGAFGEVVEAKVIVDKMSGRSKGFAFVTMADDASAEKAMELNDKEIAGRPVKVSIARPMRPRNDRDDRRNDRY